MTFPGGILEWIVATTTGGFFSCPNTSGNAAASIASAISAASAFRPPSHAQCDLRMNLSLLNHSSVCLD